MSTLVTIQGTDLPTNSRANINDNFAALNADKLETSVLDTDTTLAADSDAKVPTQRAVKAYVDAGGNPDIAAAQAGGGDFGTPSATNKFVTEDKVDSFSAPIVRTYLNAGSPHTWTKPAGLKYVVVEAVGGGAGGSGADLDDANQVATSGSSAGYCKKIITAASLGATETVTIGAAGTAGNSASTPTAGGNGGDTTFGAHLTAGGGTAQAAEAAVPGAGGTATGGDINLTGERADIGQNTSGTKSRGGSTPFGNGGLAISGTDVYAPTGYGSGGGGGLDNPGTDPTGGAPGVCYVTEYYV